MMRARIPLLLQAFLCALAAAVPTEHLVLDLDARAGVKSNEAGRVSSWTNQVAGFPAQDFVFNDLGRKDPGSGMPTLLPAQSGRTFPVIGFRQQELINADEDAFDHLTQGSGHTWYVVMALYEQTPKPNPVVPNAFFGNLRNTRAFGNAAGGGQYEGFWGVVNPDDTLFAGVRNGMDFTRNGTNNPQVSCRTKLDLNRFYIVAGRMGAGTETVPLDVFVNQPVAETTGQAIVNPKANPSKMAIGQERDATNHPGYESFNGEIARMLIYDKPQDAAEMAAVMDELKERYEIKTDAPLQSAPLVWKPDGASAVATTRRERYPTNFNFSVAIESEPGVTRRDPSDVLKVGDTYYLWYSKVRKGPGVWKYPSGYSADVWYATSTDGRDWKEQGEALGKGGAGAWDEHGVFTPNILSFGGKYHLYYTGVAGGFDDSAPTRLGVAVADSPGGPWKKFTGNPVMSPSTDEAKFDSMRIDDASLLVRDGRIWFYYKGRQLGKSARETNMGVAFSDSPTGPFVKQGEPLHPGHEVMVWPQGRGVASLASAAGPRAIYFAADGLRFELQSEVKNPPAAPGAWRSDNFANNPDGLGLEWGISHANKDGDVCLRRYDSAP